MKPNQTVLVRSPYKNLIAPAGLAASLGNFDGLHLGHQALLAKVKSARDANPELKTALISFYPHPAIVLGKASALPRLTTVSQMLRLLPDYGIDFLIMLHFTHAMLAMSAADFLHKYLLGNFNVQHLIVGPDARVGHNGQGDTEVMRTTLEKAGRKFDVLDYVHDDDGRISSRLIRSCIVAGEVRKAAQMLGRNYSLSGRVVKGEGRGRGLGFPTANLKVSALKILPACGVYATIAKVDGQTYKAVTNIGVRPTFSGQSVSIETHILDLPAQQIYGSHLHLEIVDKIRSEIRFNGVDELSAQIAKDILNAQELLRS